jgi:hypothetical protein
MNNFWNVNKIEFEQNSNLIKIYEQISNLNKFWIWTNLECEQKSLCEQILNWKKIKFEQKLENKFARMNHKKGQLDQEISRLISSKPVW